MAVQTNRLESRYLNEPDPKQIENRYQAYNQAYHWINGLIATYVILWAYAQIDLSYQLSRHPRSGLKAGVISNRVSLQYSISF